MRKSNRWLTTIYSVLLAAGLFCAQVCQVVCATVACASAAKTAQPAQPLEHGHCHQHNSSAPAQRSAPQPQPGSHDCLSHEFAISLLPPESGLGDSAKPHTRQPVCEPFVLTDTLCEFSRNQTTEGIHLKAPPRSPQRTILRI